MAAISTVAVGSFRAKIVNDNTRQAAIEWGLSPTAGLKGTQRSLAFILGGPGTRAGVIAFLADHTQKVP